jgi:membrane-associated phospholipid phosphatase
VRSVDRAALQGFQIGAHSAQPANVHHVAHSAKPLPVALLLGIVVAIALVRRRPERAAAAVALVVGAGLLTQVLKTVLATTRAVDAAATYSVDAASYPSGHATATLSLVLAGLLVVPRRLVPLAAVAGAVWCLAVSFAMLILHRHFPSDLFAGYLIAAISGIFLLAALRAAGSPGGKPVRLPLRLTAGSGIVMLILALVAFAAGDGSHTADQRAAAALMATALVVVVGVIVALWAIAVPAEPGEESGHSDYGRRNHDHPQQQNKEPDGHSPPFPGSGSTSTNALGDARLTKTIRSPDPVRFSPPR